MRNFFICVFFILLLAIVTTDAYLIYKYNKIFNIIFNRKKYNIKLKQRDKNYFESITD